MTELNNNESLRVENLIAGYGKKQVLGGVSLRVSVGEIVALIGHNGAGKSTLLKSIFGLIPIWKGTVEHEGQAIASPHPRDWLRRGVAYLPQGNRVFSDLTVAENLEVAGNCVAKDHMAAALDRGIDSFPKLKERWKQRAGTLSGGEKQMLALANAMMTSPRLLLLDEPSLGLAPGLATDALNRIRELNQSRGVTILIVEQKVRDVLKIATRVYALRNGLVSFTGLAEELKDDAKLKAVYL